MPDEKFANYTQSPQYSIDILTVNWNKNTCVTKSIWLLLSCICTKQKVSAYIYLACVNGFFFYANALQRYFPTYMINIKTAIKRIPKMIKKNK